MGLGDIQPTLWQSLLATFDAARHRFNSGDCLTAQNIYRAFINEVRAQKGKAITAVAADILIADAEDLIAHCP